MAVEYKRIVLKISDTADELPTVPSTNDHSDGSWLATDIYVGELFYNSADGIIFTRDDSDNIIAINGAGDGKLSGVVTTEADRTFSLSDANKLIELNGSTDRVFTVPPNSDVAFDIGTQILLARKGTAELDIAEGTGVTIQSKDDNLSLDSQYSGASLVKVATNTWYLFGDLKA